MRKPGRPTKLTPAVRRTFLRIIKDSGFYRDACAAVGIDETTLANWREKGGAGVEPYLGFVQALKAAEVERRQGYLRESKKRGAKKHDAREIQWRAAVTDPEVFSVKHHLVVQQQLDLAISRLKQEFQNEPDVLERALGAIAGASRSTGVGGFEGAAGEEVASASDAAGVDSLGAVTTAVGVPRPGG